MRTLLKVIGGLLLVVIAVVVVLAFIIDPNDYKGEIQTRAEAALGRSVEIGGEIDLRVGLTTALAVDGVRLANADWAAEPDMAAIDDFLVEVRVLPLLRGALEIKAIRLRGARFLLERNEAGEANWEFAATGEPDGESSPSGEGGGDISLPVLQEVAVENVSVTFRDAAAQQELNLTLDEVRLTGDGPDSPLQLALAGTYNDLPFNAGGELGAPATLARNSPYPVDIRAEALGLTVEVDGSIAEPAAASGLNLRVQVNSANLSGLAVIAGDGLPTGGPLSFAANLRGDPTRVELADLQLAFGPTELSGNLTASLAGARPQLSGELQSPRIDLAALLPSEGTPESGAGGATGAQESSETGGRVLPDTPLPLDGLRAADVDLAIDVAELVTPSLTLSDTRLGVRLANGVLTVDPLRTSAANSPLTGLLRLDATTDDAVLDITLEGPTLDLGALVLELTGQDIIRGQAALDTSLQGTGASVAAIAASLDGHSRMVMEEGMARTESFDLIVGGLTGVVSTVFTGQEEFTVVNCLATDLEFENGEASTLALVDTDLIVVTATGSVDLAEEVLDLRVSPESKSPTLSLAVPINVGGTLAQPTFAPDALSTARKVGGLVGGILGTAVFPPAALLALSDMGAADNSCVRTAVSENPDAPSAPQQEAPATLSPESVEDAVKSLGEGIRGLFDR